MEPIREKPSRRVSFEKHRTPAREPRKLVLCFDGTGNKFRGDDSDSNILKIYRMLDATATDQYHYYQPGIGTYIISKSLRRSSLGARLLSWYHKTKDQALGSSFDHHVIGGYRFLMRFYEPGDEIYLFGFSRGAYVARFLAEMLDYVGLLRQGNEEMVVFAWKAFAQWQMRMQSAHTPEGQQESKRLYKFMKGFRETFSQPVKRIRFLGLFDTVNSVPHFETAWMKRSRAEQRFPYAARSSARVIRHAVAIDERRAKFRQYLLYQEPAVRRSKTQKQEDGEAAARERKKVVKESLDRFRAQARRVSVVIGPVGVTSGNRRTASFAMPEPRRGSLGVPNQSAAGRSYSTATPQGVWPSSHLENVPEAAHDTLSPEDALHMDCGGRRSQDFGDDPAPYRLHQTKSRVTIVSNRLGDMSRDDVSIVSHLPPSDAGYDGEDEEQDIDEVWFSGGHVDVGGGWEMIPEQRRVSHIPLAWMIHEAMKAGLSFDLDQVVALGCMDALEVSGSGILPNGNGVASSYRRPSAIPNICIDGKIQRSETMKSFDPMNSLDPLDPLDPGPARQTTTTGNDPQDGDQQEEYWQETMFRAQTAKIHDSLSFSCGLSKLQVLSWNLMEYLPFKRMDLQADGTWRPIRWPLPRGEVRDIPENARVHNSVIRRMEANPDYRPGNLIIGGGGRGRRFAPPEMGIGDWVVASDGGDVVREVWVRRKSAAGKSIEEEQVEMAQAGIGNGNGVAASMSGGNGEAVVFQSIRFGGSETFS